MLTLVTIGSFRTLIIDSIDSKLHGRSFQTILAGVAEHPLHRWSVGPRDVTLVQILVIILAVETFALIVPLRLERVVHDRPKEPPDLVRVAGAVKDRIRGISADRVLRSGQGGSCHCHRVRSVVTDFHIVRIRLGAVNGNASLLDVQNSMRAGQLHADVLGLDTTAPHSDWTQRLAIGPFL